MLTGQASHYTGATSDLSRRMHEHATNQGAAILAHLNRIGIGWRLVKVWEFDTVTEAYEFESKVKAQHNTPRLCPLCTSNPQEII